MAQKHLLLTLDNVVNFFFQGLATNGWAVSNVSQYLDPDGRTCLLFRHDYNEKRSRIIGASLKEVIEHLLHYHTTSKFFSNGVEIKILEHAPG